MLWGQDPTGIPATHGSCAIDLDQAAGIEPAWAAFRAQLGYRQPTPEQSGRPPWTRTMQGRFWRPATALRAT